MYQEHIILTSRDILEKEFKIDTRGYRPQEVDKFLDIIIKDYEEMNSIIQDLEKEKSKLIKDNISLKQEIRNLKNKIDVLVESDGSIHIGNTYYSSSHSSRKFTLLNEDILVFYDLEYVPI